MQDHLYDLAREEAVRFAAGLQAFATGLVCSLIRNDFDSSFTKALDDSRTSFQP